MVRLSNKAEEVEAEPIKACNSTCNTPDVFHARSMLKTAV